MMEGFVIATLGILLAALVYTTISFLGLVIFLIKFIIQTIRRSL